MNETELPNESPDDEAPLPGLAALRSDCAPQRDLWPEIEARLRVQQGQRRRLPRTAWLAAASFAAVALIGAGTLFERGRVHATLEVASAAPLRAPAEFLAATRPSRDPAMLQAVIHSHRTETRALVRVNLKIVDNAESQLRKAMAADPDSAYLQNLLTTTRQQKQQLQLALNDDGDEK